MAIVNAVASGNYSNYAVTFGGIEPQPGDTVVVGSFTINLNVNISSILFRFNNGTGICQVRQTEINGNSGAITLTDCDFEHTDGLNTGGCLRVSHNSGSLLFRDFSLLSMSQGSLGISISGSGTTACRNIFVGSGQNCVGLNFSGTGSVTANRAEGGTVGNSYGIQHTGSGVINLGNAYPSTGASNSPQHGYLLTGPGVGYVENAFGGTVANQQGVSAGVANSGTGTIYVQNAFASNISANRPVINSGAGIIRIENAIGNTYGPGGTNVLSYAFSGGTSSQTANVFVKRLICGPYGALPVSGAVFIDPSIDNVFQFRLTPNGATKTLIDSSINSQVPDPDDVRLGVVYDNGDKTGTCAIPLPGQTLLGVPVDDTVGTAVLAEDQVPTPEQISEVVHSEDLRAYEETPHTLAWALKVITQAISTYNQQRQKAFLTDITAKRGKKSGGGNPAWFLEKEGATVIVPTSFEPDPNTYRDNYYYNAKTNALYVKIITKDKDNTTVASWKQVSQ